MSKQRTFSIVHGLDWTHTLVEDHASTTSACGRTTSTTRTWPTTTSTTRATTRPGRRGRGRGLPAGRVHPGRGLHALPADRPTRSCGRARSSSQVTRDQQIKVGAEFEWPQGRRSATPATWTTRSRTGEDTLVRHVDEPPEVSRGAGVPARTRPRRSPRRTWSGTTCAIRAGAALRVLQRRGPRCPATWRTRPNSIQGQPESHPQADDRARCRWPRGWACPTR